MYFLLALVFLFLIFLFFPNKKSDRSKDVEGSSVSFALARMANDVDFEILFRKNFDQDNVHRVHFRVDVTKNVSQGELKAIAQKIVKDTIEKERCHSIAIDFGIFGYADFAPYGNWLKAGEIPIDDYKNYRFKYLFFR